MGVVVFPWGRIRSELLAPWFSEGTLPLSKAFVQPLCASEDLSNSRQGECLHDRIQTKPCTLGSRELYDQEYVRVVFSESGDEP